MKSCSSSASTSTTNSNEAAEVTQRSEETDTDSGICSLYCLANCLNASASLAVGKVNESLELASLLKPSGNTRPFLRTSIFSNVPPTIKFYTKGHKVKKPSGKSILRLNWCQNSLLPLVIRHSLGASHFKIVEETKAWIGYWGRHLKSAQYKTLKPYQKVNHFPGAFHMGRKDRLWQHINEMIQRFNDGTFCIMPYTYVLPKDAKRLRSYLSVPTVRHVILKPPASARGTGISIVSRFNLVPPRTSLIAQHYIETPLIINGSKFDLRIYVYVTSLDPLRIYIYEEGLVRFASVAYSSALTSYNNQYMHLTNYSINKSAQENGSADAPVAKWSLSEFWAYLLRQGYDAEALRADIESIAVKALIACESHIREHESHHSAYPFISHELFGMDILVDDSLRPWLIEMNISPSLHSSTPTDIYVKAPLAKDVLNMCGLSYPLCQQDEDFENSLYYRVRNFHQHKSAEHLEKEREVLEHFAESQSIRDDILDELTDADVRCLVEFEDEMTRRGAFKLVYPRGQGTEHYLKCFKAPIYSNLLLSQWQNFQQEGGRQRGVRLLEELCAEGFHVAKEKSRTPESDAGSSESNSAEEENDRDAEDDNGLLVKAEGS